jgi:hypothetical protein
MIRIKPNNKMKKSELKHIIKEEIQSVLSENKLENDIMDKFKEKIGFKKPDPSVKNVMRPKEEPKKEVKEEKSIYALALQYLNELKPELKAIADKYKSNPSLSTSQLEAEVNALINSKTDNEDIKNWMKKGISGAFFRYYRG